MKRLATLALLILAPALVVFAADDKPAGLDGTYKITGLTKGGKKTPAEDVGKIFEGASIKGDKFTMKIAGEDKVATIKLDAKAKPATMDLTPDEGPEKGKTMKAIYKLEKGVLTIAVIEGKEGETKRPANFDGKGDDEILLELTKEEKKKDEK